MTERPEERDSLVEIENRVEKLLADTHVGPSWAFDLMVDARTLINEVKDAHKVLDEANDTMFADLGRINALINEVKELREDNARLREQLGQYAEGDEVLTDLMEGNEP